MTGSTRNRTHHDRVQALMSEMQHEIAGHHASLASLEVATDRHGCPQALAPALIPARAALRDLEDAEVRLLRSLADYAVQETATLKTIVHAHRTLCSVTAPTPTRNGEPS